MNVLNKLLFYISRLVHIAILPIIYVGILWYPEGKYWEIIGLIILVLMLFYPLIMKFNKSILFWASIITYTLVIGLFFPIYLFSEKYPFDYKNIIFYDMCFLILVDAWLYLGSNR